MTTTIVLARNGTTLSRDYNINGWFSYINNGEYTPDQQDLLVRALMDEQESEFDSLLPADVYWYPRLSEIHGPVDATLAGLDLDELMKQASKAVSDRFEEIEDDVLGTAATLYEINADLLVVERDGKAFNFGAPSGDYLDGTFAADMQAWEDGEWAPNPGDGQHPTDTDGLTPVAEWRPIGGIRLLIRADRLGAAARTYLGPDNSDAEDLADSQADEYPY